MKHYALRLLLILNLFFLSIHAIATELRIVSLAPNLTEIVYALGLGTNLVGNTVQCDYPKEAKLVYKIGEYINPNVERILSVRPNYVLATIGNSSVVLNKIEMQGIKVIRVKDPKTADELTQSIKEIGIELGQKKRGEEIANQISNSINSLKLHKINQRKFLFVIQYNPIYSISNDTWIGNLFSLAGYINVVGNSRISYPVLTKEYLIKNVPEIVFTGADNRLSLEENKKVELVQLEKVFGSKIAKNIQIVFLPKDILVRPGPRVIEGIQFIEGISH